MHAISSYRGNRPTNTHPPIHPPTHRQDRLQNTAPQLACSVKKITQNPRDFECVRSSSQPFCNEPTAIRTDCITVSGSMKNKIKTKQTHTQKKHHSSSQTSAWTVLFRVSSCKKHGESLIRSVITSAEECFHLINVWLLTSRNAQKQLNRF